MSRKDPRFDPAFQKNAQQARDENKIVGNEIAFNTVLTEHIAAGAVTGEKLAAGAVTNDKLAADSVTADKIATGAVSTSEINTNAEPTVSTIYSNSWFRSNGNTGWYNQTYGGGIWMYDNTWIRTYNAKNFYCDQEIRANRFSVEGRITPSVGTGENGIIWPENPGGGSGDVASLKYYRIGGGEATALEISIQNDSNDFLILQNSVCKITMGSIMIMNGAARSVSGYPITTSDNSIGNATRYGGYIEWYSDIGAIGTTYFASDIRKKDNVKKTTESAINVIKNIEYISFDWKPDSGNSGHVKIGMSAQQTQTVESSFVRELSDGSLMIHEPSIIPYLGKAIQEQQEIIEKQQKTIENLEARLKAIEDLLK